MRFEKTRNRLVSLLLCVVFVLSLAGPALAEDVVVYDADTDSTFSSRSNAEVAVRYSDASKLADSSERYAVEPSLSAPYAAGRLSDAQHQAMTEMTNFYRWLIGLKPLQSGSFHTDAMQKAALVRNWDFNHQVDAANKPEDMDQALWDEGAEVYHNIIAMGYSPIDAVTGWLNEGYSLSRSSWDTIGHRMALIGAPVSGEQFGYSGRVAIGVMTGASNSFDRAFAAFPAPGPMPLNVVNADEAAWTVELNSDVLSVPDGNAVTVTITELSSGEQTVRTAAEGTLTVGGSMYSDLIVTQSHLQNQQ